MRRGRGGIGAPEEAVARVRAGAEIVGQGLKATKLDLQDLEPLPGSDATKVALTKFLILRRPWSVP